MKKPKRSKLFLPAKHTLLLTLLTLSYLYFKGLPCYIVASLLEMTDWGGTGAEALKQGIDSIFDEEGPLPLPDYNTKLVSCTADGASVNFGVKTGLLTRLDSDRGWLVNIHCSNLWFELAVKDAFNNSTFQKIDEYYATLFNLIKNSGKIKSEIKIAAEALNIQHYTLPKLTGTRFVGHRISAVTRLLDMWPAIVMALQNIRADVKTTSSVKSKVKLLLF